MGEKSSSDKIYGREFARYIFMGDCCSDVNYAGIIALPIIIKCCRLFLPIVCSSIVQIMAL